MTLEILYQDEHLVVVNKPAGLLVHRTELDKNEEDAVVQRLRDQTGQWVFPVHRLDRGTSGVLVMAFSPQTARMLSEQFSNAATAKTYHCLVRGFCSDQGIIDYPLAKLNEQKGQSRFKLVGTEKEAQTEFSCLQHYELPVAVSRYPSMRLSWLEVTPKQGRKHQIRRHFKHLFHPLVGDSCYGCRHVNKSLRTLWPDQQRLMLHASSLTFFHPNLHRSMTFSAQVDEKMQTMLTKLAPYKVI